jgi:hypothetical protein
LLKKGFGAASLIRSLAGWINEDVEPTLIEALRGEGTLPTQQFKGERGRTTGCLSRIIGGKENKFLIYLIQILFILGIWIIQINKVHKAMIVGSDRSLLPPVGIGLG